MMISQSERSVVDYREEMPPRFEESNATVVRLEFKEVEAPRGARLVELIASQEPATEAREAEDRAALERQTQREQQRVAAELEATYEMGRTEGREEVMAECERRIAAERMGLLQLMKAFRIERGRYFAAVEAEVVRLALAIAARVLHREASLDPMLLQAVVKVALGKVMDRSGTVLRVPVEELSAWNEMMQSVEAGTVEVSGDSRLGRGECVLETSVGRVELGVSAQLEEIEKGFFDLLQQRPA